MLSFQTRHIKPRTERAVADDDTRREGGVTAVDITGVAAVVENARGFHDIELIERIWTFAATRLSSPGAA